MTPRTPPGRATSPERHRSANGDRLAEQIAELLAPRMAELLLPHVLAALSAPAPAASRLVDAAELAGLLGVSRAWVYEHREELGAQRIGSGPRPRLRFDVETARAAFLCSSGNDSQAAGSPSTADDRARSARRRTGRRPTRLPVPGSILAAKTPEGRRRAA
jgi:hypothetical protein